MDVTSVDTSLLERFAAYVGDAARRAGYDIDSPRGGGKKQLAEAAGMSETTISRLLKGERMPDARYFAPLAKALRVPLTDLLVQSGIIPAESLTQEHLQSVGSQPIAPDTVADSWGVQDEADRQLVRSMFESIVRRRRQADDEQDGSAEAQA